MSFTSFSKRRAEMVEEWASWASRITKAVEDVLVDARVYVFGSVVRGDHTGGSDVDILVVSNSVAERPREIAEIRSRIEEEAKLPASHPFEIHIATEEEAKTYLRKAGEDILQLR